MTITLPKPVNARHVRMTSTKRSNGNPLGLNGFEVYGTSTRDRPAATGWTDWPSSTARCPALRSRADGTVPVESGWRLTLDDWVGAEDGAALSGASVDTGGWLPATVPGTVLASLVEQGHLPDPVVGWNNLRVPGGAVPALAGGTGGSSPFPGLRPRAGRHVWLEFDGVNHQAEVWLNGAHVGDSSPLRPRRARRHRAADRARRTEDRGAHRADAAPRQPGRQGPRRVSRTRMPARGG